jgi:putative flippase GtrA
MYKQLIKYAVIGAASLAIDFIVYYSLTRAILIFHSHFIEAKAISFFASSIFNFSFNKKWTFDKQSRHNIQEISKYYSVALAALALNALLMSGFLLIVSDLIAWLLAAAITALLNFALSRFWVFAPDNKKNRLASLNKII